VASFAHSTEFAPGSACVCVFFLLCSGAFRASFGGAAAAGLAVEMKVDQAM
jgi:hypothetical protein